MTILDPRTEEVLRQTFKRFNPFMLFMWRLGLAPFINIWPEVGGQIMVIEHRGRRSGRRRYAPVNYAIVEGELYCTAGFGPVSDWYRNIVANPNIEVWMTESPKHTACFTSGAPRPAPAPAARAIFRGCGRWRR